jgi:hypothetical protein
MNIDRVSWKICSAFDYDGERNPFEWGDNTPGIPPHLMQFLSDVISKDVLKKLKGDREYGKLTAREQCIVEEILALVYQIPFAFGYVIGQMFDIPSPEIQKEIDKIKKLLREKALLPYLLRELKFCTFLGP